MKKEMTKPTETWEHQRVLNGVLQCAYCRIHMLKVGASFICPTQVAGTEQPCPTRPVNAQEILQLTVVHIINRVINEKTADQITGILQYEYGEKSRRAQEDLARAEAAIAELNALKNRAVHTVEHHDRPYRDVADEIDRINQTTIVLAYEARASRREIDGYNFVSDPDRIAVTALDPDTYLGAASPQDTRELFHMFVRNIEVEQDCITINFTDKVPETGQTDQRRYDRIPLR